MYEHFFSNKQFTLHVHYTAKEVSWSKELFVRNTKVSSFKVIKYVTLTYMHLFPIPKHSLT